ncbi:MAG: translation initiation factor IF-2 N-terminal domain-containing protein, partial [Polyangiaceae bacterium]|nr:translation initiation factor IF-2 N-terminal domain-containing protein [Polyangiaceae bacterium]
MNKVRVYELARDLGLDNKVLIQRMASMGIQVRNHMSVLEAPEVDRVRRNFDKASSSAVVEERIRPTVVRRKRSVTAEDEKVQEDRATEVAEAAPREAEALPSAPRPAAPEPSRSVVEPPSGQARMQPPAAREPEPQPVSEASFSPQREFEPSSGPEAIRPPPSEPREQPQARVAPPSESAAPERGGERGFNRGAPEPSAPPMGPVSGDPRRSHPPAPASDRFAHAHLPPGVMRRGNTAAPTAG